MGHQKGGDTKGAQCIRGCIQCLYDNDVEPNAEKPHAFCKEMCKKKGLWTEADDEALKKAVLACAMCGSISKFFISVGFSLFGFCESGLWIARPPRGDVLVSRKQWEQLVETSLTNIRAGVEKQRDRNKAREKGAAGGAGGKPRKCKKDM